VRSINLNARVVFRSWVVRYYYIEEVEELALVAFALSRGIRRRRIARRKAG